MSVKMMMFAAAPLPAMIVSSTNVSCSDSGFSNCGNPGITNQPVLTIQNGSGSFTYLWALSGAPATNGPYVPNSTVIAQPNWGGGNTCDNDEQTEQWKITVTDVLYGRSAFDIINVTRTWVNLN